MAIAMNRRRALLILIVILALVNMVGVAVLSEAWNARHEKAAHPERPAAGVQPVNTASGSMPLVARTAK